MTLSASNDCTSRAPALYSLVMIALVTPQSRLRVSSCCSAASWEVGATWTMLAMFWVMTPVSCTMIGDASEVDADTTSLMAANAWIWMLDWPTSLAPRDDVSSSLPTTNWNHFVIGDRSEFAYPLASLLMA